ncbi:hypothetical protein GGR57DRAFT_521021 [Xylariaceae sp. FL1272]|nr:hypothetical protein GGR57DRAFT_521021 [Xylariaceae sp. FL1272]
MEWEPHYEKIFYRQIDPDRCLWPPGERLEPDVFGEVEYLSLPYLVVEQIFIFEAMKDELLFFRNRLAQYFRHVELPKVNPRSRRPQRLHRWMSTTFGFNTGSKKSANNANRQSWRGYQIYEHLVHGFQMIRRDMTEPLRTGVAGALTRCDPRQQISEAPLYTAIYNAVSEKHPVNLEDIEALRILARGRGLCLKFRPRYLKNNPGHEWICADRLAYYYCELKDEWRVIDSKGFPHSFRFSPLSATDPKVLDKRWNTTKRIDMFRPGGMFGNSLPWRIRLRPSITMRKATRRRGAEDVDAVEKGDAFFSRTDDGKSRVNYPKPGETANPKKTSSRLQVQDLEEVAQNVKNDIADRDQVIARLRAEVETRDDGIDFSESLENN